MATIGDVARRAKVSPGTVSRVINGASNVNPTICAAVTRAIADLNYVPNQAARSLRSHRTRWLALLVPDITNAHWHALVRGVEDAAQSRDYAVLLCNTDDNPAKERRYLEVATSQNVAGVMIAPCDQDAARLNRLRDRGIPTVIVNRRIAGWEVDGVYSDSVSGARALVRHLIDLGHRRIAMIAGPGHISTVQDRIAGYGIALAEAGIPLDPRLVKSGGFKAVSGENLTYQVLDEGLQPTAIFAANDTIAKGVIDALGQRGLCIPQDMAVVCFGGFPESYFPFMTCVMESAYEMGTNAAQILFSRLDASAEFPPRQLLLPTRLIVRYSCGSKLADSSGPTPSLAFPRDPQSAGVLVKEVSPAEHERFFPGIAALLEPIAHRGGQPAGHDRSDVERLLRVLQHREADRLPHLEPWIASKSIYEHVLERKLDPTVYAGVNPQTSELLVAPEDQVDLARRLGLDAVACEFAWRPAPGSVRSWADLDHMEPPPSLAEQLGRLERCLRAARGTGVGVIASFTAFFECALATMGLASAADVLPGDQRLLQTLMDVLVEHQERVVRAVCDRFARDLALVMICEAVAHQSGPQLCPGSLDSAFGSRLQRLIAPARDHGKPLLMCATSTAGQLGEVLPILHDAGIDAVMPIGVRVDELVELKRRWAGRLAFVGGFPADLLADSSPDEIEARVRQHCVRLGPGGGYVFGISTAITDRVPPASFVAMVRALHRHGRHATLDGVDAPGVPTVDMATPFIWKGSG